MQILITGAGGFLGSALCSSLSQQGHTLVAAYRHLPEHNASPTLRRCVIGDISAATDWRETLHGCEAVIHLANKAHALTAAEKRLLNPYHAVNVEGTAQLAKQAAEAGVKRFIYISTIGVNGAKTLGEQRFSESDLPAPQNAYAASKYAAEQQLQAIATAHGMEWVILRPPLVYGTNAPGNFRRLCRLVALGLPLPFATVRNTRSFISIENLVGAVTGCLSHPAAANNLFLVSDAHDLSTPDMLQMIAKTTHKKLFLFAVPVGSLHWVLGQLGLKNLANSLLDSLKIDCSKIRSSLQWQPSPPHIAGDRE